MEFCVEFFALGDTVHDSYFLIAWDAEDAEDRAATWLRDAYGEDFRVIGLRGVSPLCLA